MLRPQSLDSVLLKIIETVTYSKVDSTKEEAKTRESYYAQKYFFAPGKDALQKYKIENEKEKEAQVQRPMGLGFNA